MSEKTKISIRFFDNKEIRAIWNEEKSKWFFSVIDIIGVLNEQSDYSKNRNYWKYLKAKLKTENNQLVSDTTQLKLTAKDGKKYLTDVFTAEQITLLAKSFPNTKSTRFLDWFLYLDNTPDAKSKIKAYNLFESSLIEKIEVGTTKGLKQLHSILFGGLYEFAGQIRTKNISKGGFKFAMAEFLEQTLQNIEKMSENSFEEIVNKYVEMNIAHPFMEGNGRTTRIWLDLILKTNLKLCVDWSKIDKNDYLQAMQESVFDSTKIKTLLKNALTNKINDREIFMKGIDYSYYYEEVE